ncbi:glycine-rich domain-containing protein-like [Oscillatoria sp. FACHB-1407]|uniref:glycine-rich domain-containing protein n=1 Tax=Oscillatoria sp. FACHB-1407 TaxID=2692847 RepID=UPI0016880BA6|nr:glycine-rich domain-containing protein-like [Oscillatoria sp. FACHB-1407]MBD2463593.1 glycine-rich domain-containing protein-like [Oscillatoria sp. FACHB-1407]
MVISQPLFLTNSSANQAAFMVRLQGLNLSPIAYQLMHSDEGSIWSQQQINEAIAAYKQFLFLIYCYPNQPLVPTEAIDRVWHHHVLDTQKYAEDCQFLFNRFIHHFPYFGIRGEGDRQQWQTAVTKTQALFQEHFGVELNPTSGFMDCQPLWNGADMLRPQPCSL